MTKYPQNKVSTITKYPHKKVSHVTCQRRYMTRRYAPIYVHFAPTFSIGSPNSDWLVGTVLVCNTGIPLVHVVYLCTLLWVILWYGDTLLRATLYLFLVILLSCRFKNLNLQSCSTFFLKVGFFKTYFKLGTHFLSAFAKFWQIRFYNERLSQGTIHLETK